ncbi:glycosyltransferase [Cupriavidus sp. CP313]
MGQRIKGAAISLGEGEANMSMDIILFVHSPAMLSQSMPRFASMIADGMRERGHRVSVWTAHSWLRKIPVPGRFQKWVDYFDRLIVFPISARIRLARIGPETVLVYTDQALGPWIPLGVRRPHVVHVHDFMALRSALGEFVQSRTGWTGRIYQRLIRRGFVQGRYFISVSKNTEAELNRFLSRKAERSTVVYNGLNYAFRPLGAKDCSEILSSAGVPLDDEGHLLHVGGNQWYKNRKGVLEIYRAYVGQTAKPLSLWMIGAPPTEELIEFARSIEKPGNVLFLTGLSNEEVCAAYSSASLMIFPSYAEGFGWPVAEALACRCLVLTAPAAPMTEVGADAAFYMDQMPNSDDVSWARRAAGQVSEILSMHDSEKSAHRELGELHVKNFDTKKTLDAYEALYRDALVRSLK